jgi:hypothetical protein
MASEHHDPDRADVNLSLSMSQSLADLHQRRLISHEEAVGHATEPDEVRAMLGALPPTSCH